MTIDFDDELTEIELSSLCDGRVSLVMFDVIVNGRLVLRHNRYCIQYHDDAGRKLHLPIDKSKVILIRGKTILYME